MKVHELKIWPEFFQEVKEGRKTFEYRHNDRGFEKFDVLRLREFVHDEGSDGFYTGAECLVQVKAVWDKIPGLPKGFCILEIERLPLYSRYIDVVMP